MFHSLIYVFGFGEGFANPTPPPIVGGSTTNAYTEIGGLVAIHPQGYGASFCSATLIDRYWVLTAAHCIYGQDAAQSMSDQGYDIYFVTAANVYNASNNDFHLVHSDKMIPHPGYSGQDVSNDIGLLQLAYPIDNKEPVPLNANRSNFTGEDIVYVGYGITGDGREDSGVRRTATVPYWTYDNMFIYTLDPNGEKNICSGDSGGAALVESGSGYIIVGVNSFGFDVNGGPPTCEGPDAAAGSTRVDQYLDFIEDNIGDINTDGGSSNGGGNNGGGNNGGGNNGGNNGGGNNEGSSPITAWDPPLADADYDTMEIPQPAANCAHVSGWSIWGILFAVFAVFRRDRNTKSCESAVSDKS